MKFSVIMTLYNRPQTVLLNTLMKLGANDWTDGEVVIVDDGSRLPYEPVIEAFKNLPVSWHRVDTVRDRPGTYNLDGYNNPAYAANYGLSKARGEYVFWMSSDVMVSPRIIHRAMDLDLRKVVWMPCVTDLDSQMEYLGPSRLAPLGWFYGTHRDNFPGWDEAYLKGIAFEDNDVMCRLALKVGRFVIDRSCRVWHQSHPQTAYSDDLKGWTINQKYTVDKWGGIPWHDMCPLSKKLTEVNHQMVLDMSLSEKRVVV